MSAYKDSIKLWMSFVVYKGENSGILFWLFIRVIV